MAKSSGVCPCSKRDLPAFAEVYHAAPEYFLVATRVSSWYADIEHRAVQLASGAVMLLTAFPR
jgi:hypothetical protein